MTLDWPQANCVVEVKKLKITIAVKVWTHHMNHTTIGIAVSHKMSRLMNKHILVNNVENNKSIK